MRNELRPRLSTLPLFASALLVALGVKVQAGCATEASTSGEVSGGGGGEGGSVGPGPGSSGVGGAGGMSTSSSASSSSSGSGSSSSSSSGGGGSGGGGGGCLNPMPVLVNGMDTGLDLCAGGQYQRRAAIECPTNWPDTNMCCGACPAGTLCSDTGEVACSCVAACTNDSQCAAGELCMCGDPAGVCIQAKCKTNADCGPNEECTTWDTTQGCLYLEFVCTTPADTCGGDLDCKNAAPNSFCSVKPDGHRECSQGGCAIGRPFLVEDEARTAPVIQRSDWLRDGLTPSLDGIGALNVEERAELAAAWELTARMEHASIAAFARFSLQLLGLGAPPDLIERTNRAMADETKHARAAFALASAYLGKKIGPGALAMDGAFDAGNDVATVIRLLVREGCVGETVAAVEAGEGEEHAVDPVVKGVLGVIASDESEHAELAWRTVRWALATFGDEVRSAVLEELDLLEAELTAPVPSPLARDEALLRHGVVTAAMRAGMRRSVLRRAVVPCLKALVAESLPLVA